MTAHTLPIVDVSALVGQRAGGGGAAGAGIGRACREHGFFYVAGHGVPAALLRELDRASRSFFARDERDKLAIRMELGGRAWRGYFPLGAEQTLGRSDAKEGLYFGAELAADDPRVLAGVPLHGPNQFPDVPGLRAAVLDYMDVLTRLGHALMEGVALGLGLDASYFAERYTRDPLTLFRIFHYPPLAPPLATDAPTWSVAEHTDYGMLTILAQDDAGGLQVRSRGHWIDAPPIAGTLLCNIGDMLERMSAGRYVSTPHRVRNTSGRGRLSFPFFFDPDFDAEIRPIGPAVHVGDDASRRWDGASVHAFEGTYGDYVVRKVSRVLPALAGAVFDPA